MPAYPPAGSAIKSASAVRSAGNLTLNNTSWGDIPGIVGAMDLTVVAAAGDRVVANISAAFMGGETVQACLDVASRVAGANVNAWGTPLTASSMGAPCWFAEATAGKNIVVGGSVTRVLVSGDISGGLLVCRMQYRTIIAGNRQLTATSDMTLHFSIVNLGPG